MKKKDKPTIIAVDFDGTLCENDWPNIGKPNFHLIWHLTEQEIREIVDEHLTTIPKDAHKEIAFFGGSFTGIDMELQRKY